MKLNKIGKNKIVRTLGTSILTAALVIPTVTACGILDWKLMDDDEENNDINATKEIKIEKPTYESLEIKGWNGQAHLTTPPTPPKGVEITISKKDNLHNGDGITITYKVDSQHAKTWTLNGGKKIIEFKYQVQGLKSAPLTDIKITQPTYKSLKIVGNSGVATLTNPPIGTKDYNVSINRTKNIANGETIKITYSVKDPTKFSINGKSSVTFTYTVKGLFTPSKPVDIKVTKQTLGIVVAGFDGEGRFDLPQIKNAIVTSTQNEKLSNGQNFTVTVRAKSGYTINGKPEVQFKYDVSGLKPKIINQIVTQPTLNFKGDDGQGTFDIPKIPNMLVTADKTTNLSNNDTVVITVKANKGYTVNGKAEEIFKIKVTGLTLFKWFENVAVTKAKKQAWDLNEFNTKEIMVGKQKTVVGWFGAKASDSPVVFMFGYIKHNPQHFVNAPTTEQPFILESELKEFVRLFLTRIVHGPELPALGVVTFDNKVMMGKNKTLAGFLSENGLAFGDADQKAPLRPANTSKSLLFLNSVLSVKESAEANVKPNFNNVKEKFGSLFEVIQHEYGHLLNHFQTWQSPNFIEQHQQTHPDELMEAGINNGYRPKNPAGKYISRWMVEELAKMFGIDVNDPKNSQDTSLLELLREKQTIRNNSGNEDDVNRRLALWTMRVMVGDFNDKLPGYLNRNKAYLYKGQRVTPDFVLSYRSVTQTGWQASATTTRILSDYSSGFDEMLTRMLTNMTSRPKSYKYGETGLPSLLTGWSAYYTYAKNAFNFGDKYDGQNGWFDPTVQANQWLKNGINKKGPELTFWTSLKQSNEQLVNTGHGYRVPITDTTKRDRMIKFWRDSVMGTNKVISTFIKESNEYISNSKYLASKQPWTLNVIGGWTNKQHQYLILNPEDTVSGIVKNQSTVYPIQDAQGYVSFRGNPSEDWDNKTITSKKKAWYVNFSERYDGVVKIREDLVGQKYSFWDDTNNNGIVEQSEITLIPWSDVKTQYPKSGKVFTGGSIRQFWQPDPNVKIRGTTIGTTWTGSMLDLFESLILRRSKNNSVELVEELE